MTYFFLFFQQIIRTRPKICHRISHQIFNDIHTLTMQICDEINIRTTQYKIKTLQDDCLRKRFIYWLWYFCGKRKRTTWRLHEARFYLTICASLNVKFGVRESLFYSTLMEFVMPTKLIILPLKYMMKFCRAISQPDKTSSYSVAGKATNLIPLKCA
jgi:hypothetical protein